MLDSIKGQGRVFTCTIETAKGANKVLFSACLCSTKNEDDTYTNWYVDLSWSKELKKDIAKYDSLYLLDVVERLANAIEVTASMINKK